MLIAAALVVFSACAKTDNSVQTGGETFVPPPGTSDGGRTGIGSELGRVVPAATTEYMKEAAERTAGARTGRFAMTVIVSDATQFGSGPTTVVDLDLEYDRDTSKSKGTINISGLAKATASSNEVDLSKIFSKPIDIVVDGATAFYDSSSFASEFEVSTPWVSAKGDSSFGDLIGGFDVGSVADFLEALDSAGSVKDVGNESVGGTQTTHYHIEADLSKIDKSSNSALIQLFGNPASGGIASVDIWIGDSGLIHRLRMEADAAALGSELGVSFTDGTVEIQFGFSELGADVEIEIPSDADATDLNSLKPKKPGLDPSSDWGTTGTTRFS